ncbi:MAG: DUF2975 domain-containing protein [Oscillospiraceae bacterium]
MKQHELSIWLRIVVAILTVFLLLICIFAVPMFGKSAVWHYRELTFLRWSVPVFLWFTALPVFLSLFLAWRIFSEIGRDNSFCRKNAIRLRAISILALIDTVLYIAAAIFMAAVGALVLSLLIRFIVIILFGAAMSVACAALSHLTRKASDLKDDSDLTI